MAEIKAFKALRYTNEDNDINKFICPPYDVVSDMEYDELVKNREHNMIRLELPKGEDPYCTAYKLLDEWKRDGILSKDSKDSIYIYEEEFTVKGEIYKLKGFIGRLKLTEFSEKVVLPHEETLSKPKSDRFNLMKATKCNFSQIYCLYSDEDNHNFNLIDKLSVGIPEVEVKDDSGIIHRLWVINDVESCKKICDNMCDKVLYIADGHHRYETALNFMKYCKANDINFDENAEQYVMTMFVNIENDGLVVLPTHRLLQNMKDFNLSILLDKCMEYFDIIKLSDFSQLECKLEQLYKGGIKAFAIYAGKDNLHLLILKDTSSMSKYLGDKSPASQKLDVNILHKLVLDNILGIDKNKLADQSNLTYTRNLDEAISSVDTGESQCAFIMNPTSVDDIRGVSDAHEKMPQKSTYFYPKLITGLVINEMK